MNLCFEKVLSRDIDFVGLRRVSFAEFFIFLHHIFTSLSCILSLTLSLTLRKLREQNNPPRRNVRRIMYPMTPLLSVNFWRICLDESQLIGSTLSIGLSPVSHIFTKSFAHNTHLAFLSIAPVGSTANGASDATRLAMRLRGVNRWCVTGTPINNRLNEVTRHDVVAWHLLRSSNDVVFLSVRWHICADFSASTTLRRQTYDDD